MQIVIRGKDVEITKPLREHLDKRLSKVSRLFNSDEVTVNVLVSSESLGYGAELTIPVNGLLIRAEERSGDLYSAVDMAVDKTVRQINRFRGRLQARRQGPSIKQMTPVSELAQPDEAEDDDAPQIVRIKRFPMRPMSVEEAILQMNMLGHDFFVFANADTDQVSVVYSRKDGKYGLIEPAT